MTNSKTTKRALFSSVVALLLCFTMLLGTTFAWFTDSASSDTNKIVAGNLDVELYHADKAQPDDELVGGSTKLFDDVTLWEPGAIVWEKLTVKNNGTLALKYNLSVNVTDISSVDGKSLADVLKVAVLYEQPTRENVANAAVQSLATFNLKSDKALTAGSSDVVYVAIYWAPSANDNDYNVANEALYANLGVTLLATQYTAESDSFNNQYDKDATYEGSVNLGGSSAEVSNLTETVWQVTDSTTREAFNVHLKKIKAESSLKVEVYHDDTLLTTSTLANSYFPITEGSFATQEGFNRLTANIVLSGYTSDSWNTVVVYSNLTEDNIPNHIKVYCDGALVANEYRIFDDEWVAAYKDLEITKKSVSAEIEHLNSWTVTDTATQEAFNVQLKSLYVEDSLKVEVYHDNTLLTTTTANDIVWDLFENGYAERLTTLVVLSGSADEYWTTVVETANLTEDNVPNNIKVYCDGVLVADENHTFDDAWIAAYRGLDIVQ